MANALYPFAKAEIARGNITLLSDNLKVVIVDLADYTYSAAHQDLADVLAGARIATSGNLANKSISDTAVFDDSDDITFTSVTGDQFEAVILYKDSGVEATSTLIAFIDTGTGMVQTPDGGNIILQWNASGIFQL